MAKKKLGKYELGKTIGEGTFAKVKFAQNTETGESVAIKVMAKSTILKHKMVEQVFTITANHKVLYFLVGVTLQLLIPSSLKILECYSYVWFKIPYSLPSNLDGKYDTSLFKEKCCLNCYLYDPIRVA